MTTKYKILFMIELLHDYYSNLQCPDFEIIPSEETRKLIRNQLMMCKMVGNKLIVLVKVKTDGPDEDKPLVDIHPGAKFLFYLQLNRTQFNIVTNLNSDKLRDGYRYYFTNQYQNKIDNELKLTGKIEAVAGPASYMPGDLTAAGAVVYECIKKTTEANNPPAAGFWYDRGSQQYVSQKDMLKVKTRIENIRVTAPATQFVITVRGFDTGTNDYTKIIPVRENIITSPENTRDVQVKLPELPAGRYKLDINGELFDLFIDDAAVHNNVFGIIEVFSHFANGTPFSFLDGSGKVKDKLNAAVPEWLQYRIRFANRLAYWKYKTPRNGVLAIDGAGLFTFNHTAPAPGVEECFTSGKPIPLLQSPWKFKINVQALSNDEDPFAPNPDPDISGLLSRIEPDKDYYCTITLNY